MDEPRFLTMGSYIGTLRYALFTLARWIALKAQSDHRIALREAADPNWSSGEQSLVHHFGVIAIRDLLLVLGSRPTNLPL